jgi:hypothetical protein
MMVRSIVGASPRLTAAAALAALTALVGCEDKPSKLSVGTAPAVACDLKAEGLAGTEWVINRINPDKTEVPDHAARLKFFDEGGKLKAKYNVMSVAAMYTYDCEVTPNGLTCKEAPKPKDYCQALVAGKAECTPETLKAIAADLTDEQIATGIKEANEVIAKFKGGPDWGKFEFNNNNLGNKLRGILYVKVNDKQCNLRVTDNYMTIYNGKKLEDSNPVGTNAFVKNSLGELLWEDCKDTTSFIPLGAEGFPADPAKAQPVVLHPAGSTVHYYVLAADLQAPVEGCSYSYQTWLSGKPLAKDLKPAEVDGPAGKRLEWHVSQTFDAPSATGDGEVLALDLTKTCAGKEPEKRLLCAQVMIK